MRRCAALFALALWSGCTHAPRQSVAHPTWPPSPAAPQVRYLGGFPDERTLAQTDSTWTRVFEAIVGLDDTERLRRQQALLSRPFGVAARGDTLWIADPDGRAVLAVAWRLGTFTPITCPRDWQSPMAVAVDEAGALYVADSGLPGIVRVANGVCTPLPARLERPVGLAVVGQRLFVVDPPRHAVVVLSLPEGTEVQRWGGRGEGEAELNFPTAIAAGPGGTVAVVDALNFRVTTFSPDGKVTAVFGRGGGQEGDFGRPKAVAVDPLRRYWVSDAQYAVALAFDESGSFLMAVGGSGREPTNLSLPAGVAVSGRTLFLADAYHRRVEFYELLEVSP